jgi:hypothetical protein
VHHLKARSISQAFAGAPGACSPFTCAALLLQDASKKYKECFSKHCEMRRVAAVANRGVFDQAVCPGIGCHDRNLRTTGKSDRSVVACG